MKTAMITGVTGQDGAYLAKFLLDKGYRVYGTYRRLSTPNFWRLQYLGIFDKIDLIPMDLIDATSIVDAVKASNPTEVYNIAAQSFVGASFEQPVGAGEITGIGVLRVLEAIRNVNPDIKFYQASTSEMYGDGNAKILNENSVFRPSSPYAVAKLYGYSLTRIYREAYGMFACNGILFNHESPLRGLEFVTRKITNSAAKIYLGVDKQLSLGNLDAKRDWGYAPEYVEAMWMVMNGKNPDDFVIATNESHSVREFVEEAFSILDLDWKKYVKIDKRFTRPLDVGYLQGDYTKAKKDLGWKPKTTFKKLVKIMIEEDLKRWQDWKQGKSFPWDAANYPDENKIISKTIKLEPK